MSDKAFPRDTHLTSIAIAYKNPDIALVADKVFPRVPVELTTFGYTSYPVGAMYDVPDTQLGEESRMNRVRVTGTKLTDEVVDRGIVIPLTNRDIKNAPKNVDPREKATERATNIVLLDRERRCVNLAFDPAQYPASQKKDQDAGANLRFDEAGSDPIAEFLAGFDACLVRPNRMVMGGAVWTVVRQNPKVIAACNGTAGGVVTRERLAEVLELAEVIVGASRINSAKPGKAVALVNLWGKKVLSYFSDSSADTQGGVTFGYTAEYGTRRAGSKEVEMGLDGGVEVMAGESVKEMLIAPYGAFLHDNAIA